jgi:hypothetical protein
MSNSAFNMSKCGSGGGSGSSCNSTGWTEIQPTDGNDITVVSTDKLREALREIYLEDKQDHITQVADIVKLVYDCPKEGDAVFYNATKGGYDLASAEIDNSNYFKDPEHLIESLAIVEKVRVTCQDGQDVPDAGYTAKVVFFGKITFSEDSPELDPGMVYYLANQTAILNTAGSKFKPVGSNAVHAFFEPTISKPLFVSTGTHTAIVTNYRPLTGSPTGGREILEEYSLRIDPHVYNDSDGNFISTGWKIRVDNTGTVSSRNHLLLQIEYNKLEGPQSTSHEQLIGSETYVHHIDIGILHNEAEAGVKDDDEIEYFKIIDFNKASTEYCTGIGEVSVKLKVITQSTANINIKDKLASPEVLLTNADDIKASRIVPTLEWRGSCADNLDNDNDIFVKGNQKHSDIEYEEGSVFEVKLVNSVIDAVGGDDQYQFKVEMPYNIGFKVDALIENSQGEYESDPEWSPITNSFGLSLPDKELIEIIPVSSAGTTIVEKNLRISATKINGDELPDTHWANIYSATKLSNNRVLCLSNSCCIDEYEQFIPENSNSIDKSITSILTDGDSALINNKDGATFHSKGVNRPSWSGSKSSTGTAMGLSWKNCRENTIFCYPPTNQGTTASFMTIYADEARVITDIVTHEKVDNESQFYDPRYTLMEIGAQNTLDGHHVRLTVNSGSSVVGAKETCYVFKFNGSNLGTHFTLEELRQLDPSFSEREIQSSE